MGLESGILLLSCSICGPYFEAMKTVLARHQRRLSERGQHGHRLSVQYHTIPLCFLTRGFSRGCNGPKEGYVRALEGVVARAGSRNMTRTTWKGTT